MLEYCEAPQKVSTNPGTRPSGREGIPKEEHSDDAAGRPCVGRGEISVGEAEAANVRPATVYADGVSVGLLVSASEREQYKYRMLSKKAKRSIDFY